MNPRKTRVILTSLKNEVEALNERIKKLVSERQELNVKLTIEKENGNSSLIYEKAELDERIDILHQERDGINGKISDIEIEQLIEGLVCQKDFICHSSNYEELCSAGFVYKSKMLKCLEEESHQCNFSLFKNDIHLCECPVRNYIAETMGK